MIRCPRCDSERFYYVTKIEERHTVLEIPEHNYNGADWVELGDLDSCSGEDAYTLECTDCAWEGSKTDYLERMKQCQEPKKNQG